MRLFSSFMAVFLGLLSFTIGVLADDNFLAASSLVTCMDKSLFSASQFDVKFYPNNRTVHYSIVATSEIDGKITAVADVYAYGFKILSQTIDFCSLNLAQICPISPGQIDLTSTSELGKSIVDGIPGIAYTFPNLDAIAIVSIYTPDGTKVACLQATFDNGKTVNHIYVKWITAVIAGIGLLTSAIASAFGHSNTAAHIAANSVSLFVYFQTTVIFTMEAVARLPPIASAWGQNLAWSMGLIEVPFMQKIFRWFVQATGGKPTTYLSFKTISILIQKRFLSTDDILKLNELSSSLSKRATSIYEPFSTSTLLVLRGILRVAYEAHIEQTSVVLTGITIFFFFSILLSVAFMLIVMFLMLMIKVNVLQKDRFSYFRLNWLLILKGTLLRIVLIGFPQLLILSMWEFIQRDSPAVIVLAVFALIMVILVLGWAFYKVSAVARRSMHEFKTPSYLLFADQTNLNRYGFLYIQYNAAHYYFVTIYFGYVFCKSCFISFAQSSGKTQALALFIFELAFFVMVCVIRPFMDKRTNILNIIIGLVNTINAFMFMFFSQLFGQPAAVASIMGVVFFVLNAIFSLILIIMTLTTCTIALLSKNPDNKYHPSKDDRDSFIKPAGDINGKNGLVELTALGAAAQADHDEQEWRDSIAAVELDENKFLYTTNSDNNSNLSNKGGPYDGFSSGVIPASLNIGSRQAEFDPERSGLNEHSQDFVAPCAPARSFNSLTSSDFDMNGRQTRGTFGNDDFEFYNNSDNTGSINDTRGLTANDEATAFINHKN
ncbi:TRP-domain-containing protein [Nadsonia fulvescens var. elongata DSM 6958]|uniref:TRP-domain-containing protein n=1 Tax=Nadsonia fulvescens var. elongata DSM 6958 TaxID=857566 RepID=A0A1E3PP82_9ASCO|nr:TRP-domain-containing protein [Nadsonia fulvescens var. elongata DSM 6958]